MTTTWERLRTSCRVTVAHDDYLVRVSIFAHYNTLHFHSCEALFNFLVAEALLYNQTKPHYFGVNPKK